MVVVVVVVIVFVTSEEVKGVLRESGWVEGRDNEVMVIIIIIIIIIVIAIGIIIGMFYIEEVNVSLGESKLTTHSLIELISPLLNLHALRVYPFVQLHLFYLITLRTHPVLL